MSGKKRKEVGFVERMRLMRRSGLDGSPSPNRELHEEQIGSLTERLEKVFDLTKPNGRRVGNMLFFVMYDIENNKVRTMVSKYLVEQGCTRIQKSIFLADLPPEKYDRIRNDLQAVQEAYENEDSILIVPISTDYLNSMKVIGRSVCVDVITRSKNTLFF